MRLVKNRQKGFTLIELLVVISIIGLLSSILVATFSNVRDKARYAVLLAQFRNLRTQLEIYYTEYGNYPYNSDPGQAPVGIDQSEWITDNALCGYYLDYDGAFKINGTGNVVPSDWHPNTFITLRDQAANTPDPTGAKYHICIYPTTGCAIYQGSPPTDLNIVGIEIGSSNDNGMLSCN